MENDDWGRRYKWHVYTLYKRIENYSICPQQKIRYTAGMKMKTSRAVIAAVTVLTLSIVFAACTPPPPKPADDLNLSFGQTNQTPASSSPTTENQTNPPQKGP